MNYNAESIKVLDAIDGIRMNVGMYIGGTDSKAYHHLLLEIISNSVDESSNGFGNKVLVKIDSKTQMATVQDWGRGIPNQKNQKGEEVMAAIFTQTHSSGKFNRDGYASSIGTHGLGASAVNALSTYFKAESCRDGYIAEFVASLGREKSFDRKTTDKKETYSIISFVPDNSIFKDATWNKKTIEDTLRTLSFLTPNVEFVFDYDGEVQNFLSKDGLKDLLKYNSKDNDPITDVIYLKDKFAGVDVEIAMQYNKSQAEKIYAFTNGVQNPDGGTSVTGVKTGFTNFINKNAKELGLLTEDQENLSGDLIRKGMVMAIHVRLYEKPEFSSQTKDKLMNPIARTASTQAAANLVISKADLKTIIEKALIERKAEDAAKRAREAAKRVVSGGRNLSRLKDLPAKLKDCNLSNGELFLCEGDSAAGAAEIGRDPQHQAIFPLRGKVLNTFGKELSDIIENEEVKNILTILGCGIGENFNIKNLRYDKVVVLSDSDVDGAHINILLITLFLEHLPELIKQGKIYRAVSPLYRVKKGKDTIYLENDKALEDYIKKNGTPKDISRFKGLNILTHNLFFQQSLGCI